MTKQLQCKILSVTVKPGFSSPDYYYGVFEDGEQVACGISSSEAWVKHDAGGYHTKTQFDLLYPDGWVVNFDF